MGTPAAPLAGIAPADCVTLFFLTSSCAPCRHVWTALAELGPRPGVVVVTPSSSTESLRAVEGLLPRGTPLVMSSRAWFDYGAGPAPWMAVVRGGLIVGEGPAPLSVGGLGEALDRASAGPS